MTETCCSSLCHQCKKYVNDVNP